MKQQTAFILTALAVISLGVVFISTKERGVVKNDESTLALTPVSSITHAHGLGVDVVDPTMVYIATHHGLLVLKNDKELYQVGNTKNDFMGFSAHPTNAKLFYSSGHPPTGGNLGILKTIDQGVTWEKISNGGESPVDFHAMTISGADANILYGVSRGALLRSTDAGKTWGTVYTGEQFFQLTADPLDPLTVYGSSQTGRGILVSHDQGRTWQTLSESLVGGGVYALAISPHNRSEMLSSGEKLGGLGMSNDGGKSWTLAPERFSGETITHIAYDKNTEGVVVALTHTNRLFKSLDNGVTWKFVR